MAKINNISVETDIFSIFLFLNIIFGTCSSFISFAKNFYFWKRIPEKFSYIMEDI